MRRCTTSSADEYRLVLDIELVFGWAHSKMKSVKYTWFSKLNANIFKFIKFQNLRFKLLHQLLDVIYFCTIQTSIYCRLKSISRNI